MKNRKIKGERKWMGGYGGGGGGEVGSYYLMGTEFLFEMMKILETHADDDCTTL